MYTRRLENIPVAEIDILRDSRQRRELPTDHIENLAQSFRTRGLLSPIIVKRGSKTKNFSFTLCAGECRLTAWKKNEGFSTAFKSWSTIPAFIVPANTSRREMEEIELVENIHRRNLHWLDEGLGILSLYELHLKAAPAWTFDDMAALVGLSKATISRQMRVARAYLSDKFSDDFKEQICESNGIISAINLLERKENREKQSILDGLFAGNEAEEKVPEETFPDEAQELSELSEDVPVPRELPPILPNSHTIRHWDFHTFAKTFSGTPFNFLHLDFPYGTNLFDSPGMSTAADFKANTYADSEDVYWDLLRSLANQQKTLLKTSAHIMFWFSQNFRAETEQFFLDNFAGCRIEPFLMVWHKSDNVGIVPDSQRYGRRNYETAMLITLGDRKIVSPKALCFAAPGKWNEKSHRSEKPLAVLAHFMSMFVDHTSNVADFTCGSGTSIQAAELLGASSSLGLELSPENYGRALENQTLFRIHQEREKNKPSILEGLEI